MAINYIKEITVKKLFGELDIKWQLDPKVNILIGKNGSGKTTLLRSIKDCIMSNNSIVIKNIDSIKIKFDDGNKYISATRDLKSESILRDNIQSNTGYDRLRNLEIHKIESNIFPEENKKPFSDAINSCYINTFEVFLTDIEDLDRSDKHTKNGANTELDLFLRNLINDWKSYLLTLRNREAEITVSFDEKIKQLSSKTSADANDLQELKTLLNEKNNKIDDINFYKNLFIRQINALFSDSKKQLDIDKNNSIIFRNHLDKALSIYQLSSGEKQILVILLNVLHQKNQPSIILMDEPEVSLHLAWQHQLIDMIQSLNENCQLIIVTHAAGVFSKGWQDKITKMAQITTR
ncbi:MAG: AAA family ATPase [Thiomargarita sp.]|nr:AAA family ATPase [Thiomargarita sp.]